ncbi:MAG: recombinase family protein [Alphaproteobacteria bacterium]|jgi:DNA invertase Pin-like site-specific DNA recombinase|nr:recombinase family protein [Alphaproteobacteria bacterium]
MDNKKIIRCAIYTRKSTEDGLDQEYNTLDAQRDAGENYINSQRHEGWRIIPTHYDDGGFTGGNMERPALKQLMADIEAGLIDVVVVYKIDRLSRSLTDFAQMVDLFDKYDVSFVSVTQHFNTKDSMGRLTLNILFSFAQFEREVIGERIRDKFAASKKKGIFMGGALPLGYESVDRKLEIVPAEARLIRYIFRRYVEIKSISQIIKELDLNGHRTKMYKSGTGKIRGGRKFNRQYIYRILNNKLYLGQIVHKDKSYPGQHEAIISQDLWDAAHAILSRDRVKRGNYSRNKNPTLLRGLVRCNCCDCAMTPTFTKKDQRIYRYYTPTKAIHRGYDECKVGPVPAAEIDALVVGHIRKFIESPEIITQTHEKLQADDNCPHDFGLEELRTHIGDFDSFWKGLKPKERNRIAELLVKEVSIDTDEVAIDMRLDGFTTIANTFTQGGIL